MRNSVVAIEYQASQTYEVQIKVRDEDVKVYADIDYFLTRMLDQFGEFSGDDMFEAEIFNYDFTMEEDTATPYQEYHSAAIQTIEALEKNAKELLIAVSERKMPDTMFKKFRTVEIYNGGVEV